MAVVNNEVNYIKVNSFENKPNGCEIFVSQYNSKLERDREKEYTSSFEYFVKEIKSVISSIDKERIPSIVEDIELIRSHKGITKRNIDIYSNLSHFKKSFLKPFTIGTQFSIFFIGSEVNNLSEAYSLIKERFDTADAFQDC